jgi:pyruvate/2-oxoglutarate dehydrogenase complex dihydrolipoamide acyltransferase (E2) component
MSINIVVPEVGESIVDARVAKWLKKEGDSVRAGEPLVELETDKVDVEVAAPKAGVLQRIAHGDGADVKLAMFLGEIEARYDRYDRYVGYQSQVRGGEEVRGFDSQRFSKEPLCGKSCCHATKEVPAKHERAVDTIRAEGPREMPMFRCHR